MGAVRSRVKVSLRDSPVAYSRASTSGLCLQVVPCEPGLYLAGVVFEVSPGVFYVGQKVQLSAAYLEQPDRGVIVDAEIPSGDDVGGEVWGDRGDAAGETQGVEAFAVVCARDRGDERAHLLARELVGAHVAAQSLDFVASEGVVHHSGLADDKRLRGHSSLPCAVDAQILCERKPDELATTLTLQKLKDEESNLRLRASLSRVVVGTDEDGDDVSTLVVDSVEDDGAPVKGKTTVRPPRQLWLIMDAVTRAIEECGSGFKAFGSPTVRAVSDEIVRERYYARIAERASDDEDGPKVANRQRQAFNRAINAALNAKDVMAQGSGCNRMLWLPTA
jgi:hypothetical protein